MQVYLKIHTQGDIEVIAVCDNDLIEKELCEENLKIKISNHFYRGKLVDIDYAIEILSNCANFNIVGKNIIKKALKYGIIHKSSIRKVNNIPMALKMVL